MRILMHAIDGVGLGHIVRTVEIAKSLRQIRPEMDIVFVTNSEFPDMIEKEGFRCYRLERNTRMVMDGTMSYDEYASFNAEMIGQIISKETPDAVLLDSELGIDIIRRCRERSIAVAYVLRKTKTSNLIRMHKEGLLAHLSLILIPHDESEIEPEQKSILDSYGTISYVGPLLKTNSSKLANSSYTDNSYTTDNSNSSAPDVYDISDDSSNAGSVADSPSKKTVIQGSRAGDILKLVITFAGGSHLLENDAIFDKVSNLLKTLNKNNSIVEDRKVSLKIFTGPFFKQEVCNLYGYPQIKFSYDFNDELKKADLVIAPSGYNTINDIIQARTPAILIPVPREEDDQFLRAEKLEKQGCAIISGESLYDEICDMVSEGRLKDMENRFPTISSGNRKAAALLSTLVGNSIKIGVLRAHWLPLSERFILDELNSMIFHKPVVFTLKKDVDDRWDGLGFNEHIEISNPDSASQSDISNKHIAMQGKISQRIYAYKKYEELYTKEYPMVPKRLMPLYGEYIKICRRIIESEGIGILHAHYLTDGLFFLHLSRATGLPLVVSVRGHDLYSSKGARDIDCTALFSEAALFLVRSERMRSDLIAKGCSKDKIAVHHSGIMLDTHMNIADETGDDGIKDSGKSIRIVMVGRLVDKKGFIFGIDVFDEVCNRLVGLMDSISLSIIGDGPLFDKVKERIDSSRYYGRIQMLGQVPNVEVRKIMESGGILFHPSVLAEDGDMEGVPNAVMEAMASGMVVVASDSGSIAEIIEDGNTGYIFPEKDIEEAAVKLLHAIDCFHSSRDMRLKALDNVRKDFDVSKQTAMLEAMYSGLLKATPYAGRSQKAAAELDNIGPVDLMHMNYQAIKSTGIPVAFRADIHPIRGCDSFCIMCDNWKSTIRQYIGKEDFKFIVDGLKELNVNHIRFHGQEPTLSDLLPEMMAYAKSAGFEVSLKTNCNSLDDAYCRLIASDMDRLYVSVDSPYDEIHDRMRGSDGSLRNIIRAASLIRSYSPSVKILSNSVVTSLNFRSLQGMPDFAFDNGIERISFVLPNRNSRKDIDGLLLDERGLKEFYFKIAPKIISRCHALGIEFDFSPFFSELVLEDGAVAYCRLRYDNDDFLQEIKDYAMQNYGKEFFLRYGCYGNIDHMTINYDGNLYPCCVVERRDGNSVGNAMKDSIMDIWRGERYSGIRSATLESGGMCCVHADGCASNFRARKALFISIKKNAIEDERSALAELKAIDRFQRLDRKDMHCKVKSLKEEIEAFAFENVGFYKDRASIDSAITTKQDLRENFHSMLAPGAEDFVMDRTSGSFSETVQFAHTKGYERYLRMIYPFIIHSDWIWGDPYYVFTTLHCGRDRCSSNDLPGYVKRMKVPTSHDIFIDKKALDEAAYMIKDEHILHGDPFYLAALARHTGSLRPKAISSTYEMLQPSLKRYLEKRFKTEVFNTYGCSEVGPVAFECESGNMHIYEDRVNIEIIGKDKDGIGDIVVTDLLNRVMPLIRYSTGDIGRFVDGVCSCGRNTQMIEIHGRKGEVICIDGSPMTERMIGELLDIDGIIIFQIDKRLNIRLIIDPEVETCRISTIKESVARIIPDCKIEIVDSIAPECSGKFRIIETMRSDG